MRLSQSGADIILYACKTASACVGRKQGMGRPCTCVCACKTLTAPIWDLLVGIARILDFPSRAVDIATDSSVG